ncbi:MAG: hypothetical protein R3F59_27390 [Myxococcota bacterium]
MPRPGVLLLCVACQPEPHRPPPWAPAPTDTAAPEGEVPLAADGWGACATVRSLRAVSPYSEVAVVEAAAAADGSDLVLAYEHLVVLVDGTDVLALKPLGEAAHALVRRRDDGGFAWALPLDGTSQAAILGVGPAPDGGAYLVGTGDALTSFPDGLPVGGAGEADAFVARVGGDGQLQWVRTLGSAGEDQLAALAPLPDGGVAVAGALGGEATVDGVPLAVEGMVNPLLARYGPDGDLAWALTVPGAAGVVGSAAYDTVHDEIVALGTLSGEGTAVFGAGTPAERRIEPGLVDTFVARFGPDGAFHDLTVSGSSVRGQALALAPDGAALAGGSLFGVSTFARGEPGALTLPTGGDDWFARFEPDGRLGWLDELRGDAVVRRAAALPDGRVAVLLAYTDEVTLGAGDDRVRLVAGSSHGGAVVVDTAEGALACALPLQGDVDPTALAARPDGGLEVAGTFWDEVGAGTDTLQAILPQAFQLTLDP